MANDAVKTIAGMLIFVIVIITVLNAAVASGHPEVASSGGPSITDSLPKPAIPNVSSYVENCNGLPVIAYQLCQIGAGIAWFFVTIGTLLYDAILAVIDLVNFMWNLATFDIPVLASTSDPILVGLHWALRAVFAFVVFYSIIVLVSWFIPSTGGGS